MTIQITNTCKMGCPHCMQCSTDVKQHMVGATFEKFISLITSMPQNVIMITGGEPTEHPAWYEMCERTIPLAGMHCVILTNGMWFGNLDQEDKMLDLLKRFDKFSIQVSSYDGLYKNCSDIRAKCKAFMLRLKAIGLKKRVVLCTDRSGISMVSLGRCKEHPELLEEASKSPYSTSCITNWSFMMQFMNYDLATTALNLRGHFCFPFIDWTGEMHFSESWLCPAFATLNDSIEDIKKKALKWKPCGACEDFKKVLTNQSANYVNARKLLGI